MKSFLLTCTILLLLFCVPACTVIKSASTKTAKETSETKEKKSTKKKKKKKRNQKKPKETKKRKMKEQETEEKLVSREEANTLATLSDMVSDKTSDILNGTKWVAADDGSLLELNQDGSFSWFLDPEDRESCYYTGNFVTYTEEEPFLDVFAHIMRMEKAFLLKERQGFVDGAYYDISSQGHTPVIICMEYGDCDYFGEAKRMHEIVYYYIGALSATEDQLQVVNEKTTSTYIFRRIESDSE